MPLISRLFQVPSQTLSTSTQQAPELPYVQYHLQPGQYLPYQPAQTLSQQLSQQQRNGALLNRPADPFQQSLCMSSFLFPSAGIQGKGLTTTAGAGWAYFFDFSSSSPRQIAPDLFGCVTKKGMTNLFMVPTHRLALSH